jgi:hypothetical protein
MRPMNRSEFNSYSLLEIENETLRQRLKAKDQQIEVLKTTVESLVQIIKKSDETNVEETQAK